MIGRRIVTIFICLLLLTLFIFPGQLMETWCRKMDGYAQKAQGYLWTGHNDDAIEQVRLIRTVFDEHKQIAKLMLNHEDIDNMDASIRQADAALMMDEGVEASVALAGLITSLEYIQKIERLSWINLI